MIRIITKEVGYGKENFVSGIFVAASAIALCTYFYHYDLFVYRSKGAGQLDWVFHQTLFIPVCCGYTSFIDKCLGQHPEHCLDCSYRIYFAGQYYAIGIFNLRTRARKAISFVNNIPILNGDIIIGISLFLLFVSLGIPQGYTTVVLAHITFCTPYVVLSVLPRLKQMNPNIYEAALDLGATPMQALRKVIVPEILPGMISGFMLAVTLSIDDFAVTVFTIGNEGLETLSTYIYADARKGGLTPELRPLSTIIFVLVLVLLVIINRHASKKKEV